MLRVVCHAATGHSGLLAGYTYRCAEHDENVRTVAVEVCALRVHRARL